ncbi:MAG: hypothetical protein ACJAUV_001021 [Flavobacteriales bacterium]|jgi:hypothetical protein
MPEEFIKIRTWVTEHAQSAYDNKYYIEAIQVLHGWIENKLQEILILTGSIDYSVDSGKTWGIANQINLIAAAKMLFIISKLNEDEYQKLTKFNRLRNQVIHKIYHEPYENIYEGVPKKQYDEVFNLGMNLAEQLQRKTEKMIE